MRIRAALVGLTVVGLLTACGTGGGAPTPPPTPTPTTPAKAPAELTLPEDAVLGLVGIVTAPNGATADLAVIVHATLPWMAPDAAPAVAATVDWCAGEVDEGVIEGRGYTFTRVDIRLTARDGAWPDDLTLAVLPQPNPQVGSTNVAATGLRQVDEDTTGDYPDAVPHCRQPTLLDGLGDGTLWLGIPQDITGVDGLASFTAWTTHAFGLSAVLPGDLGTADVLFSSCASALTPLGEEFGAPTETWADRFADDGCSVGGS
jgi:hypothetical protein